MIKQKIAITTLSLIRTKKEAGIVLETIKALCGLNVPVVLVDGGSDERYLREIEDLSNIHLYHEKSLENQLRRSLVEGSKIADSCFYTHTDKLDFAKKYVKKIIEEYMRFEPDTMFVASRTNESFATYPEYQRKTEEYLNYFHSDYLGVSEDYYYGPKIFSSKLVKYLDLLDSDFGWGFEALFYILNHRLGFPLKFYKVECKSPEDVGSEEDVKSYRLKTVKWHIESFLRGVNVKL